MGAIDRKFEMTTDLNVLEYLSIRLYNNIAALSVFRDKGRGARHRFLVGGEE
jgi:hypothetical protein